MLLMSSVPRLYIDISYKRMHKYYTFFFFFFFLYLTYERRLALSIFFIEDIPLCLEVTMISYNIVI